MAELECHLALCAWGLLPGCAGAGRGIGLQVCIIHCSVGFKPPVCIRGRRIDLTQCCLGSPLLRRICGRSEQISGGQPYSHKTSKKHTRQKEGSAQDQYETSLPKLSSRLSTGAGERISRQAGSIADTVVEKALFSETRPCCSLRLLWLVLVGSRMCFSQWAHSHPIPLGVVVTGK